jgi:hypothetical protein
MQRLSFKYVSECVDTYNKNRGLKYKDKGYLHLGGDSGWYDLQEIAQQGGTATNTIKRGTLRECHDALFRLSVKESGE